MTDDSSDTFLGALLQMIIGLAGMVFGLALIGGSLVVFVALLGAAFNIFTGNAPSILEPFGGTLAGLLADLVYLLRNLIMLVIGVVVIWLMATGQLDETLDEMFDVQQSSESRQQKSESGQTSAQSGAKQRPSGDSTSLADGGGSTNKIESSDETEYDIYGQIREK